MKELNDNYGRNYDLPFREYSDPWAMDKDGKFWFDPEKYPKEMRK